MAGGFQGGHRNANLPPGAVQKRPLVNSRQLLQSGVEIRPGLALVTEARQIQRPKTVGQKKLHWPH